VARLEDDLGDLLDRIGRRSAGGLRIDDVAAAVGDALKTQRRAILKHVGRMIEVDRLKNSPQNETRYRNLHARLTAAESAIRFLQKDRSR
jgi:hypothetical protein